MFAVANRKVNFTDYEVGNTLLHENKSIIKSLVNSNLDLSLQKRGNICTRRDFRRSSTSLFRRLFLNENGRVVTNG